MNRLEEQREIEIGEGMTDDENFKLFSAEQILKDDDLSYEELASGFPSVSIDYAYVTRGSEVHPNVERKVDRLKSTVEEYLNPPVSSFDSFTAIGEEV